MMYLLDTNVCIGLLRGKTPLLLQRINTKRPADIYLCSVVLAELRYGAEMGKQAAHEHAKIHTFAQLYLSLSFTDFAAERFGIFRAYLDKLGTPIGPYDLMIASIALVNGLSLVTNNSKEFSRVPGLVLEDWQSP
jgi:tRNA(fMet)-specific endonuclease VapC